MYGEAKRPFPNWSGVEQRDPLAICHAEKCRDKMQKYNVKTAFHETPDLIEYKTA